MARCAIPSLRQVVCGWHCGGGIGGAGDVPVVDKRMAQMSAGDKLEAMLIRHEDLRLKPYDDATGKELRPGDTLIGKLTIGVGRNLTDVGITPAEAMILLNADIGQAVADLRRNLKWFDSLNEARQAALIDMRFNLGLAGLSGFPKMLDAMYRHRWKLAAAEAKDSKWARQVGGRSDEIADMIRSGEWQMKK